MKSKNDRRNEEKNLLNDFDQQIDSFGKLADIFTNQGNNEFKKLSMTMKKVAETCYAKIWGDVYGWKSH